MEARFQLVPTAAAYRRVAEALAEVESCRGSWLARGWLDTPESRKGRRVVDELVRRFSLDVKRTNGRRNRRSTDRAPGAGA